VTKASAINVDIFMMFSWGALGFVPEGSGFLWHGLPKQDKPRNLDRFHHGGLAPE